MITIRRAAVLLPLLAVVSACTAQPAVESSAAAASESVAEASAPPASSVAVEPSQEPSDEPTPSPSPEAADICDLVLAASDAPDGSVAAGEPEVQTLDFYRDAVEAAVEGSPGRASAEANLENYESWGFVERCSVGFSDETSGAGFTSFAMRFEDESGSAGYVAFLQEGCEVMGLPASLGVDGTGVFCSFGRPTAYVAVTDGPLVQAVSYSAPAGSAAEGTALLDQAAALLEAMPAP